MPTASTRSQRTRERMSNGREGALSIQNGRLKRLRVLLQQVLAGEIAMFDCALVGQKRAEASARLERIKRELHLWLKGSQK